ncbi:MAG: GH32 C-terminal domain-containing protein, partial [Clostridia bacterium]|nr:GH32 C-terminal domain-containing protein [Clostridia bacterium]
IAWHILNAPADNFASQMSFPTEMSLEKSGDEIYLASTPIKEIEKLYVNGGELCNLSLAKAQKVETGASALDIAFTMPYIHGEKFVINMFGTDLACDMEKNEIRCKNVKMPLSISGDKVDMRIIVDRCSVEIFADGGKIFAAAAMFADYNLPYVVLRENEKIMVDNFTWHTLKNIH